MYRSRNQGVVDPAVSSACSSIGETHACTGAYLCEKRLHPPLPLPDPQSAVTGSAPPVRKPRHKGERDGPDPYEAAVRLF